MIKVKEYMLKHRPCAVCCNEGNILGKDWFILMLSKAAPYHREVSLTEYAEIREVKQMQKDGEIEVEHISKGKDLTVYVLKGKAFNKHFQEHRTKCRKLEPNIF